MTRSKTETQVTLNKDGTPRKVYDRSNRPKERTEKLTLRLSPKEKQELKELAETHNVTITELLVEASKKLTQDHYLVFESEFEKVKNSMSG